MQARSSISLRMMTTVTPLGPAFFCAPSYSSPTSVKSTGREKKSLDASTTSGAWIGSSCRVPGSEARHLCTTAASAGTEGPFASVWRRSCGLRHGRATVCRQSAWLLHAHYVPATNPHHGTGNFIIPGGDPCDNTAPALASLQAGPSSAADPGPLFQGQRTGFHATSGAHSRRLGCRYA